MAKITLKTAQKIVPMIYAYSTPEIARHNGWVKIGYTEKQTTQQRQKQQAHTVDVIVKEEWRGNAVFDDGSGEVFHDFDFHAYLTKLGIERKAKTEWFNIDGEKSFRKFCEFRQNKGILQKCTEVIPYNLRDEQNQAVTQTAEYYHTHPNGEFLWNAKPRFGKTLAVYDLCKRIGAKTVLVVTNRPAIATSWYGDYEKFLGIQSGYRFVSTTEALKNRKYVITREKYTDELPKTKSYCIEFVSLQDLKGSLYFGGRYDKLREVADLNWDILVVDEAHEGVDTYKTDIAFNQIKRKFTLHLSGTPFKALANDKFPKEAIFNWTYADEQKAKAEWSGENENPYATLPKLNMFTYQMSEIVRADLERGVEINGETEEYAFDLNEFFRVQNGKFVHEKSVDRFLKALTTQEKFPFSTPELREELKHTFWLLNRVDSVYALAKKLKEVFPDYKIVRAAGNGKSDDEQENMKSFDEVRKAIREHDKTITLSVGQLTTGITIPEWSAVMMLSNIKSPALYMQAAFRAQNPCLFRNNDGYYRKQNAYVFDFDPARTLTIFEEFANDLSLETSDGRGNSDQRKENIRTLLNFFPVIGEDEHGEMIELNAEKVLSIPRKIRSAEVVHRGFMSNFLFQNISNVFNAPSEVIEMIKKFTPIEETPSNLNMNTHTGKELSLNDKGEVDLPEEVVIGRAAEIFGDKIFSNAAEKIRTVTEDIQIPKEIKSEPPVERLKEIFRNEAVEPLIMTAAEEYGKAIKPSERKRLEKKLKADADRQIEVAYGNYDIQTKRLENEQQEILQTCTTQEEVNAVKQEFAQKKEQVAEQLKENLSVSVETFITTAEEDIVRTVETSVKEQEKNSIENSVKAHLRGFSRTIPSFLMAYGNDSVTLENFDKVIPDNVFFEVTGITISDFCFLRDGGDYTQEDSEEVLHFEGNLFDPVVFNDSVKEFMRLRTKLADYFDEKSKEDIFDYIPPQKTNQIFTPRKIVRQMVDLLEQENPNCYDDPNHTFIDPYMKSGLYITEIVKRLYRSKAMKKRFPKKADRLKHIFEHQVYGLAPTEIIYRIAINYIFGFDEKHEIQTHNFKQCDALIYAKDGTLQKKIDELFG